METIPEITDKQINRVLEIIQEGEHGVCYAIYKASGYTSDESYYLRKQLASYYSTDINNPYAHTNYFLGSRQVNDFLSVSCIPNIELRATAFLLMIEHMRGEQ